MHIRPYIYLLVGAFQFGFLSITFGQQMIDVTIRLDKTIALDSLMLHYDDGLTTNSIESGAEKREVRIQKPIYAPYGMFDVAYGNHPMLGFFVDHEPTLITISAERQANGSSKLHYSISNGTNNIWDTTTNSILSRVRRETREELTEIGRIYQQHGHQLRSNDSVQYIMQQERKKLAAYTIEVLKDYPNDYFAFFYFKNQIVTPDMHAFFRDKNDSTYFSQLLSDVRDSFSPAFINCKGGKGFIEELSNKIQPPSNHGVAPDFNVQGIDGERIHLRDLRGRYVLLDFWATWCPPCMAAMPSLKKLRQDISEDKLNIIGISSDRDLLAYASAIQDKELQWIHFLDSKKDLGRLFNVERLPTVILIDPKGNMIYRKVGAGSLEKVYELIEQR